MFGMGDSDESIDPLTSARGPYAFRHTPSFLLLILTRNLTGGYNFKGVTRWFAERADVILLFFDPDKPGIVVINPTTYRDVNRKSHFQVLQARLCRS